MGLSGETLNESGIILLSSAWASESLDVALGIIETSSIKTFLMEFRDKYNKLVGVILLDVNSTTLSAV